MQNNKNLKFLNFILLATSITLAIFYFIQLDKNDEIINRVETVNRQLESIFTHDSTSNSLEKEYSNIVTKYIQDCNFVVGDKKVGTSELLKMMNDNIKLLEKMGNDNHRLYLQNDTLRNESIEYLKEIVEVRTENNKIKDSLVVKQYLLDFVKKNYGLNYEVKWTGGRKITIVPTSKKLTRVDSALILYPRFKQSLYMDTVKNRWYILQSQIDKPKEKKQ